LLLLPVCDLYSANFYILAQCARFKLIAVE
jgi:hypothetical protein